MYIKQSNLCGDDWNAWQANVNHACFESSFLYIPTNSGVTVEQILQCETLVL